VRTGRILLPGGVRRGGNTALFDLIARTELEQVRRGRGPLPIAIRSEPRVTGTHG
jgi:hypothetical protein